MSEETKEKKKAPIPEQPHKLEEFMKERVGLGTSFDFGIRKYPVNDHEVNIYYINGLTDANYIQMITEQFVELQRESTKHKKDVFDTVHDSITHQSVEVVKSVDEIVDQVLSGLIAIVVEGYSKALIVDVRSYPGRTPQEPDTEKVVRGSRDGYVENIIVNTALTRRRIRDERLRFEMLKVGERSKTDVSIGYIKDVANSNLVDLIRKEIKGIEIDGIAMADKTIEEFLVKQGYNPYPLVRYTERADVAATHLLEGHVLIYTDTSPSIMITPTTFFHHVQHAEEYRQSAAVGTFIRWARFIGILMSLFLLPFWLLLALEPSLLPEQLAFIGPNEQTNIPLIMQIFMADIGIEFLRIAAIHTPTPLSTAMGLIAAVLIGQIAIDVGLFVPETILYVAIASIGTFTTPSYELSVANKMVRLMLLIGVALFGVPGFVIGSTLFILLLTGLTSLRTPYLWPLMPFNGGALFQILIRRSVPGSKVRPSIVRPRDRFKQPEQS